MALPVEKENNSEQIEIVNEGKSEKADQTKLLNLLCFACKTAFYDHQKLGDHIDKVHGIIQEKNKKYWYRCPKCEEILSEKKYLRNHIAWVHDGKRPEVCNRCNMCFLDTDELEEHYLITHKTKKPTKTKVCSIYGIC